MSAVALNVDLIRVLSMMLIITTLAAAESRRLRVATLAYGAQALLIVALLLSFATINPALYWWAGTAFVTKAVLTPLALVWYIRRTRVEMELPPLIGFVPSVVLAAVLMVGFFQLTHSHADILAPSALAREEVFRTNLAVAATVFVLGLYAILSRRDAVKTVIGLCLLENGVHLSLVSLVPGLPETALFGIATEVVITAFLLLYVIAGVYAQFGTTDTLALRELRG